METRYMVDTTSQELPIEERHFWSWPTPLYFFSQKMITAQVTLLIFLQTCVFLTVWKVFFFFPNRGWLYVKWTFVVTYCQIDIFDKYVGGHLSLAYNNNYRWTWIQILACECFFFPFHLLFFLLFVLFFFYFSLFLLFIIPLELIKLQMQKNVGLVIIQRVVRRCSIEGRQDN